jgi:hypothetical protein
MEPGAPSRFCHEGRDHAGDAGYTLTSFSERTELAGGRVAATRPPEPPYARPSRLHQREGRTLAFYPFRHCLMRAAMQKEHVSMERVLVIAGAGLPAASCVRP